MPGAIKPGSPALGVAFKVSDGDLKGHNYPAGDPRGHVRPAVTLETITPIRCVRSPGSGKVGGFWSRISSEKLAKIEGGLGIALL